MPHPAAKLIACLTLLSVFYLTGPAYGWHDKTHLAISQAAGYANWYNSAAPDVTKTKADDKEATNQWFNNNDEVYVTPALVLAQVNRYNDPEDLEGHLYGAIIHSLRDYKQGKRAGKYAEYNLAFCAHYIGDLSMPLHNAPHDAFNRARHSLNDGVVEFSVLNNIGYIQRNMSEIKVNNEADLAREIARLANISRRLADKLKTENRDLTQDEAYKQLVHSASLLKAVLAYATIISSHPETR
jgi:hypothetical protein